MSHPFFFVPVGTDDDAVVSVEITIRPHIPRTDGDRVRRENKKSDRDYLYQILWCCCGNSNPGLSN